MKPRDGMEYDKLVREVESGTLDLLRTNRPTRSRWLVISAALFAAGAVVATLLPRFGGAG